MKSHGFFPSYFSPGYSKGTSIVPSNTLIGGISPLVQP